MRPRHATRYQIAAMIAAATLGLVVWALLIGLIVALVR